MQQSVRLLRFKIIPAELLLKPGETQKFKLAFFDANGVNVRGDIPSMVPVEVSMTGPGKIGKEKVVNVADEEFPFTMDADATQSATILKAKIIANESVTTTARIRCVPPLPWKFDFNDTPLAQAISPVTKQPVVHPVTKQPVIEGEPPVTWISIRHRRKIREIDGGVGHGQSDHHSKGNAQPRLARPVGYARLHDPSRSARPSDQSRFQDRHR